MSTSQGVQPDATLDIQGSGVFLDYPTYRAGPHLQDVGIDLYYPGVGIGIAGRLPPSGAERVMVVH